MALPGLVGLSRAWADIYAQARAAARDRVPLLIVGEQGVGKLALARAAHQDNEPARRLTVIDCANDDAARLGELPTADRTAASTIILRHLERLDPAAVDETATPLDGLVEDASGPWVVGTMSGGVATHDQLLRRFAVAVTVPPLRHRISDLHELVPALLKRLAPGRHVECTPDVLRVLARNAWPGNVAELEQVLRAALTNQPVGSIRREYLPASCFATSRRVLTPIEALERDAIVRALADADGNRKQAAADLGMSRSSLYRKMHAFGITYAETGADS